MGTIRLYQVDFEPSDNFYVEDIESYFKTLSSTSVRYNSDKLNYLKLGLNITVKLPLNQLQSINQEANYAAITQEDNTYYYFITGANWTARRTVKLQLTLDTVQTWFKKLNWSDKTQIIRTHKNRFEKISDNTYRRKIDNYNEGLNPAKSVNQQKTTITGDQTGKFYLAYLSNPGLTQDSTSDPLFIGLFGTQTYKVYDAVENYDITISLEQGYVYYVTDSLIGTDAWIQFTNGTNLGTKILLDTVDNEKTARVIELYPQYQGTGSWYRKLYYTGNTYPYSFSEYSGDFTTADYQKLTLHNIRSITKLPVTKTISTPNNFNINIVNLDTLDYLKNETVNAGTLPAVFTENFTNFDRSNSRLSKIIELPYCPVPVVQSGDIFKFTSCIFVPGYNILKIDAASVLNLIAQDTRINDLLYLTISKPTAKDSPNQSLESKLYSSEFYDFAYYYDTDKMPIRLEDFTSNSQSSAIGITYAQTLSLNSDKQFHFYPLYGSYNQIQPFETYLNCSRNTERLVLNSSYADYLKNGYNYDQWAQKQAQKQAATNAVISAISAGVSFIPGVGTAISNTAKTARAIGNYQTDKLISNVKLAQAERYERENPDQPPIADSLAEDYQGYLKTQLSEIGNSALKSVSGVGNLVINNGVNAINNTISAARSIEQQKRRFTNAIASKSASPVSASGSTPTDLFDNYTDNKLIRFEFRPRDYEITNLWQKFRLTGYATAVNGIPDFNSRIYSNFVQCNAVFNNESTEIYKIYLDDIKQRFAAGVTVKHNYNGVYDLKDIYENYETFVLN